MIIPSLMASVYQDKQSEVPKNPTSKNTEPSWLRKHNKLFLILCIIFGLCLIVIAILITVIFHHGIHINVSFTSTPSDVQISDNQPLFKNSTAIDPNANLTLPSKLKLVSRLEWLAQPPIEPANPLQTPVPYVIILHTATENCSSQTQCVLNVRFIQTFHIESRNWWDIGYNFLVGGDGEAYEGRGWKSEGAHTFGYNGRSIGIAFIGSFNSLKPPDRQILACKQLIAKGVELGYIRKDYKLLAARQLHITHSPGLMLYEDMKTWEHWAEKP